VSHDAALLGDQTLASSEIKKSKQRRGVRMRRLAREGQGMINAGINLQTQSMGALVALGFRYYTRRS
jgi:hypothetical protein